MIIFLVIAFALGSLLMKYFYAIKEKNIENKHVVITGGSSGIGKCVAILCAKNGAHVTIIARNVDRLKSAHKEIKDACINDKQIVTTVSVDVSNYDSISKELQHLEEIVGPIYGLINCAGMAICGKVEDISVSDINTLINVNLLGTLYPIKAIVSKLKQRKEGFVVLTASQAALMGMFGYSVYSACKFGLRGIAESIDMELRPYNVSVTLALPPDTDTPGLENENKSKPIETKLISQSGGLYQPEDVAKKLLKDTLRGNFFSFIGFESAILTTLCIGMSPFTSFTDVLYQSFVLGPLRLISSFYLLSFHKIVKNCMKNDDKKIK